MSCLTTSLIKHTDMQAADEEIEEKRKPFKLSFIESNLPGRSNIQVNKPLHLPPIIAPKFYAKYSVDNEHHEEIVKECLEKLKVHGPREKFQDPVTQNQKYGWYQIRLTDADPRDRRLNFHKRTNIIVREHLMNYAKIRE